MSESAFLRLIDKPTTFVGSTASIALISSNRLFLKVAKADYPTLQDLYSMIQTNNIQVVYELATPLTYSLTKQQIRSLVGVNNFFADTGDSVVDYRKLWVKPEM